MPGKGKRQPGKSKRQRDQRSRHKNQRQESFWKDRGYSEKPNLPDFLLDAVARQDKRNRRGII